MKENNTHLWCLWAVCNILWLSQLSPSTLRGKSLFLPLQIFSSAVLTIEVDNLSKTNLGLCGGGSGRAGAHSQRRAVPIGNMVKGKREELVRSIVRFPCFLLFCLFPSFEVASSWEKHLNWYEIRSMEDDFYQQLIRTDFKICTLKRITFSAIWVEKAHHWQNIFFYI